MKHRLLQHTKTGRYFAGFGRRNKDGTIDHTWAAKAADAMLYNESQLTSLGLNLPGRALLARTESIPYPTK